mmetsp:Transcript_6485/g.15102  ORF Transcript_6485/g.15102 Transcript_6485/m.15102 type:complete len:236 (+) Transcript_6485:282-989(+)
MLGLPLRREHGVAVPAQWRVQNGDRARRRRPLALGGLGGPQHVRALWRRRRRSRDEGGDGGRGVGHARLRNALERRRAGGPQPGVRGDRQGARDDHQGHQRRVCPHRDERKGGVQVRDRPRAGGAQGGAGERGHGGRRHRLAADASGQHPHHGDCREETRSPNGQGHHQSRRIWQHERRLYPPRSRRGSALRKGQAGRYSRGRGLWRRPQLGRVRDQMGLSHTAAGCAPFPPHAS